MLTREDISVLWHNPARMIEINAHERDELCEMALALLDVADMYAPLPKTPVEVVDRVRSTDETLGVMQVEWMELQDVLPGEQPLVERARNKCALVLEQERRLVSIADLVPGDGDVVERVRNELNRRECVAREAYTMRHGVEWPTGTANDLPTAAMLALQEIREQLRRAEQERDEARRECTEYHARVYTERYEYTELLGVCDDLRAKLAALADAAEEHRNAWRYPSPATADRAATRPRLDAAIAAAREALK